MLRTIYSLTGVLFDLAMPGTKVYMGRVSYSCRLVELESRVPAVKVKQTETHSGNREKACSLDTTSGLAKSRQNFCHLRRVHWQASDKNWQKWIFRNAGLCPRGEAFRWPVSRSDNRFEKFEKSYCIPIKYNKSLSPSRRGSMESWNQYNRYTNRYTTTDDTRKK